MGAFDHLEWTYGGAFEQLFGLGMGEFEQKFSKNSNARGVARGRGMLKLRFDWYIISVYSKKAVPQMHSFGFLKKHLQPDAIPYILSKLTTELYPGNLSLTHFDLQDTREDNNGLPVVVVVVDSHLRTHRCFHRMYATKNCLRSCTEKK